MATNDFRTRTTALTTSQSAVSHVVFALVAATNATILTPSSISLFDHPTKSVSGEAGAVTRTCPKEVSMIRVLRGLLLTVSICSVSLAERPIQTISGPTLSPDGNSIVFSHRGDLWRVSTEGGPATRLTVSPSSEMMPKYSPTGDRIAFVSDRTGSRQIHVMDADGGDAEQLTFHTEGYGLEGWFPDGRQLLVSGSRDHFWRNSTRFMTIDSEKRSAEQILFDGYCSSGSVSPDGDLILFVREGEREWRKGYHGSRAARIWQYQRSTGEFQKLVHHATGSFAPVWMPDGSAFLYCGSQDARNGARNLWRYDLQSGESVKLTQFEDDLVMQPAVSQDGSTIIFTHLFDLYRLSPEGGKPPVRIAITEDSDDLGEDTVRRSLKSATDLSFSKDGLEMAFIAGGDLWVMETVLKEPVQITHTAEFESDPVISGDGNAIYVVGWRDGKPDIMRIERADENKYWWQNTEFRTTAITDDASVEASLALSPNGKHIAYLRERGDLWIRDLESGDAHQLVESFSAVAFDFSPDGKWITYSKSDNDFNSDIWIVPVDQSEPAVNISRHPDNEYSPVWSPDGKLIAFSGRRMEDEVDIYYVWLAEADDDIDTRDRRLKETLEKLKKARKSSSPAPKKTTTEEANGGDKKPEQGDAKSDAEDAKDDDGKTDALPRVVIDFKDIHRRLKRISIANSSERGLSWSPDGRTLVFSATVDGESGTYRVKFPDELTPKKVSSSTGRIKGWLKSPERILWLSSGGVPAMLPLSGSGGETYAFDAPQEISRSGRYRAGFETAWRVMRDNWYNDDFGNHNWNEVRRKYVDAAAAAVNDGEFRQVIELMLGELNGSHLGFYSSGRGSRSSGDDWRPVTAHLGVRFDSAFRGPGLKVRDVIPEGPATQYGSEIHPGEVILSIDGTDVDPDFDLTTVLNGRLDRDIHLRVRGKGKKAEERDVMLRPTTYGRARSALYQKWQDDNRKLVERRAENIGYLHIQGMNWPSFLEFERELYDVGYGKDGLIIDVRDNGGGSTTDHLLTALTQPTHAITVPRGGGQGYPHDRKVYASWDKPIVVMCNQNSYSNAEIFSHAIKGLGRGKLVGVPTAGGVISTGARSIMDLGTLRLPFRGWFVKWTGEDMEMNGAVPDVIIWPLPTEIPNGRDRQLNKAVQLLQKEIKEWKATPTPKLIKATERED
jgi:tricorn protease